MTVVYTEVRLAQLETLAVIHPVPVRHHKNDLEHIIELREVVRKQLSTLAKFAKENDETRDIGQTIAVSRSHRGAYNVVVPRCARAAKNMTVAT